MSKLGVTYKNKKICYDKERIVKRGENHEINSEVNNYKLYVRKI
jgi:hypothetical protein